MDLRLCQKAKLYFYYTEYINIQVDKLINHIKDCAICQNELEKFYKSLEISPVLEILINNFIKTQDIFKKYGG